MGIVIPIYNVEKYLRECLDSVINQTYKNIEVVLVNDGSTDENSLNIAKEYTLKDERFILFDKENGGQSTARNVGIEYFSGDFCFNIINEELQVDKHQLVEFSIKNNNSRAIRKIYKSSNYFANKKEAINFKNPNIDFIVFLDPDDYWTLDCIEECVKRSDNVDIVWFDYQMFYDNIEEKHYKHKTNLTKSQMQIYEYYKPEKITSMQWLERCLKIQADLPFWCVCGGIYSFAYLQKIKLKFLDGLIHEDVHFGMLLFAQAKHIYVFPKVLYYYRIRSASTASYDKITTKANITPYIEHLCDVFDGDVKAAKEYHAKSSIFLNAWHIREFIANKYDKEKGKLLEEAFFMFLYFWYFDFVELKHDPRRVKELFKEHKPIYECNYKRYPEFDFFCKYGLVRYRIQNQLSYRLGKIVIEKSKSFFSILILPYFIFKTIIDFKLEKRKYLSKVKRDPSQALPKIEEYPDFIDAWKIQEHLSYQIGQAILQSLKKWYKLGILKLPFIIFKINKKKRNEKKNINKTINHYNSFKKKFYWKDENLINIAENKNALQSSAGSIIDAFTNRVLQCNLKIQDYAFSTTISDQQWLLIDLKDVYNIEKIRIINIKNTFKRYRARSLEVMFSLDGVHWMTINREINEWRYNDFYCELNLSGCVNARYVKIYIERSFLHLSKVEVLKRDKAGYIISSKPDGLGMRLASMLIGMYLAKKLDFNFGFTWVNSIDLAFMGIMDSKKEQDINYLGNCMDEVDVIFDHDFIEKYLLNPLELENNHGLAIRKKERTFHELKNGQYEELWGWYSTDVLPSKWIKECDEKECLFEIKNIYKNISFSKEYIGIIKNVDNLISRNLTNFIALHIRGGDIIFSNIRKTPNFTPVVERLFPYEIAIDIALKELKNGKNIIIFGQDLNANKEFARYLKSFVEFKHLKIINVDDLVDENYTEMQRAFFEINLMSKAEKIYSARESVFSKVAMMISGCNKLISFHDIFSAEMQMKLIKNNMNHFPLHPLQNAMSYFRLFQLSKELNYSFEKQIKYLYKALDIDHDNDGYRIHILQCLFLQKKYKEIDSEIKAILKTRYKSFFENLLPNSLGSFDDCFKDYIDCDDETYPYIVFVGSKISKYLGDLKKSKYLYICALKNQQEKEFIKSLPTLDFEKYQMGAVEYIKKSAYYRLGAALVRGKIFKVINILKQESKQNKILKDYNIEEIELGDYLDCNKALEFKNHLSYQLGKLLLQTHSKRYKGAYLLLPYRVYNVYKNFKSRKENNGNRI
ncbi:TPA: glycosyltransferase [Campylobacter jejuni]|nr:glycosyltransferase [Campylobacter jejuni]